MSLEAGTMEAVVTEVDASQISELTGLPMGVQLEQLQAVQHEAPEQVQVQAQFVQQVDEGQEVQEEDVTQQQLAEVAADEQNHIGEQINEQQNELSVSVTPVSLNVKEEIDQLINQSQESMFPPIDTIDEFERIFCGKEKFESWEDFVLLFEEYQKVTLTAFKARSATCVSYVNEKRVTHKIPDKFVYQTVKMICIHYGTPKIRENSAKKHTRYVALQCGAYVTLSYKKGFLHITDMCLIHTNHPPMDSVDQMDSVIRKIRPVTFTDELDLIICQLVDQNKVFDNRNNAMMWQAALFEVQDADVQLQHMTQRMLKKRIAFLMERYAANSGGHPPLSNDHMGILLHGLIEAKRKMENEVYVPQKRGRKRKSPSEAAASYDEYISTQRKNKQFNKLKFSTPAQRPANNDDNDDMDNTFDNNDNGDDNYEPPSFGGSFNIEADATADSFHFENTFPSSGSGDSDMAKSLSSFFTYWKSRDEEERKVRTMEIAIRQEEMLLRRKELELQKERLETETNERKLMMELLKVQGSLMNQTKHHSAVQAEEGETTEYIVLSDGQLEHLAKSGVITQG